jgi:transposase
MEETSTYEQCRREELIQLIVELKQIVSDQSQVIEALSKKIEGPKPSVRKESTKSSIPTSKELIQRTRSQREKSGKPSGGQAGHKGFHRERNPEPNALVHVQARQCHRCGACLEEVEGRVGQVAQEGDLPPIQPWTTEYQHIMKTCACGECNVLPLPIEGYVTVGPRMGAFITSVNVEHALPSERFRQICQDVLGFAISEGTIENTLKSMQEQAKGILKQIKEQVMKATWTGSDETGANVGGKKDWNWVWQSSLASYVVMDQSRGYHVVKEHFTEDSQGVICHDCWSAQNKTPAGAHQFCHAHLVRNVQDAVDAERSAWAYRVQRFVRKSQRARDAIWQEGVSQERREAVSRSSHEALDALLNETLSHKEERRRQKRLIKHKGWIPHSAVWKEIFPNNDETLSFMHVLPVLSDNDYRSNSRFLHGSTRK